jgi:hypothetical protein
MRALARLGCLWPSLMVTPWQRAFCRHAPRHTSTIGRPSRGPLLHRSARHVHKGDDPRTLGCEGLTPTAAAHVELGHSRLLHCVPLCHCRSASYTAVFCACAPLLGQYHILHRRANAVTRPASLDSAAAVDAVCRSGAAATVVGRFIGRSNGRHLQRLSRLRWRGQYQNNRQCGLLLPVIQRYPCSRLLQLCRSVNLHLPQHAKLRSVRKYASVRVLLMSLYTSIAIAKLPLLIELTALLSCACDNSQLGRPTGKLRCGTRTNAALTRLPSSLYALAQGAWCPTAPPCCQPVCRTPLSP